MWYGKKLKEALINSVQSPKLLWDFFIKLSVDKSDNTMYNKISNINPFLYRGYYYDRETGLYYLNTRYYDPETGRFINADDIANLDSNNINGLNLYAYCFNNPVNDIDTNGTWSWKKFWKGVVATVSIVGAIVISVATAGTAAPVIVGTLMGGVIGAGFEIGKQLITTGSISNWKSVGLAFLGGAVSGAVSSIPGLNYLGTALVGGLGAVSGGYVSGSVTNFKSAALSFGIGAAANVAAKFITDKIGALIKNRATNFLNKPMISDFALEDLIGSGLKNNGNSAIYNNFLNQTSKALLNAQNHYFRSFIYMFSVSGISSVLSGWI